MVNISKYKDFEHIGNKVNGKYSPRVMVFDIDDTILKSVAKVKVMDEEGNMIADLTSSEYNSYKLNPGEHFDYTEFRDLDILLKSKMTKYWSRLKEEYSKGTHISIITARGGKDIIYEFFKRKGITIKYELIYAVGDFNNGKTVAENKSYCIEDLIKNGYNTLIFFDDNEDNLAFAANVGRKHDVKVVTVHVQ